MVKVRRLGAIALGWLVAGAGGCAGGDSAGGTPGTPTSASASASAGSGATTGSAETGGDGDGDDDDDDAYGSSSGGSSGTTTTGPPTTGAGQTGGESSSGESGDAQMCIPDNTCPTAPVIGGVAGDEPSPDVTQSGATPTWVGVEVSEHNASAFGEKLTVTITLQSIGGDFDLRAYRGSPQAASGCDGSEKASDLVDMPDSVRFSFGEGAFGNMDDDGFPVAIEIVAKDDTCVEGATWMLTVAGDT